MKKITVLMMCMLGLLFYLPANAQNDADDAEPVVIEPGQDIPGERRAQTGFKFLGVSPDARAAAMGNAFSSIRSGSTAMFYNAAAMAYYDRKFDVAGGQVQWIADVNYITGSAAFVTNFGVFGLSLVAVDYGDFLGTVRFDNAKGFIDTGAYSPSAFALGFGYARAITDRFSVGGDLKIARQDMGAVPISITGTNPSLKDFKETAFIVDFGVLYWTGFKSLNFALSTRNFATERKFSKESFELPLTFRMGLSMDLVDLTGVDKEIHSFLFAIDTERPRDFNENVKMGAEYTIMKTLSLRMGYTFPSDEEGISLGVGVSRDLGARDVGFDYAYTDFGEFDAVHRLGVHVGF